MAVAIVLGNDLQSVAFRGYAGTISAENSAARDGDKRLVIGESRSAHGEGGSGQCQEDFDGFHKLIFFLFCTSIIACEIFCRWLLF